LWGRKTEYALLFVGFLLTAFSLQAQQYSKLYPYALMAEEKKRFQARIGEIYEKGIEPYLTDQQKVAVSGVRFDFPLPRKASRPIDFYSHSQERWIAFPVLSLKFVEDLSIAYAWLWANHKSFSTIDEYITMLRYRQSHEFDGQVYPAPLMALGIPENVFDDKKVDDMSLRFRNTAYAFILLHELGHILYQHKGYEGYTAVEARSQEELVDDFAINILDKTATLPMGAILFFQAQAYWLPNRGQVDRNKGRFLTDVEWQRRLNQRITHPLTSDRLQHMARQLGLGQTRTINITYRESSDFISERLYQIGAILNDEDIQKCMSIVGAKIGILDLKPRSQGNISLLFQQWCH